MSFGLPGGGLPDTGLTRYAQAANRAAGYMAAARFNNKVDQRIAKEEGKFRGRNLFPPSEQSGGSLLGSIAQEGFDVLGNAFDQRQSSTRLPGIDYGQLGRSNFSGAPQATPWSFDTPVVPAQDWGTSSFWGG